MADTIMGEPTTDTPDAVGISECFAQGGPPAWVLLILSTFPIILNLPIAYFIGTPILQHHDAQQRFLTTQGTVLSSRIVARSSTHRDSDGHRRSSTTWDLDVEVEYYVEGQRHICTRLNFATLINFITRRSVEPWLEAYPKGAAVAVHYDPDDPSNSVLCLETPWQTWWLLMFGQVLMLGTMMLLPAAWHVLTRQGQWRRFVESPMQLPWRICGWGVMRPDQNGLVITQPRPHLLAWPAVAIVNYLKWLALAFFVLLAWMFIDPGAFRYRPLGWPTQLPQPAGWRG